MPSGEFSHDEGHMPWSQLRGALLSGVIGDTRRLCPTGSSEADLQPRLPDASLSYDHVATRTRDHVLHRPAHELDFTGLWISGLRRPSATRGG